MPIEYRITTQVKDPLIVVGKTYPVKYGEIVKIKEVIKYF